MDTKTYDMLVKLGLNPQQINSKTTDVLLREFMGKDNRDLVSYAESLVKEANKTVQDMRGECDRIKIRYEDVNRSMLTLESNIKAIIDAKDKYGEVQGDALKDILSLYGALVEIGRKAGATGSDSVRSASYVMWAFLVGGSDDGKEILEYEKEPSRGVK